MVNVPQQPKPKQVPLHEVLREFYERYGKIAVELSQIDFGGYELFKQKAMERGEEARFWLLDAMMVLEANAKKQIEAARGKTLPPVRT